MLFGQSTVTADRSFVSICNESYPQSIVSVHNVSFIMAFSNVLLRIARTCFYVSFELLLNAPVNSYGHVETSSPFYGTLTQN